MSNAKSESNNGDNGVGEGSVNNKNEESNNDFEKIDKDTNNKLNEFGQIDKVKIKKFGSEFGEYIDYKDGLKIYSNDITNMINDSEVPLEIKDYVEKYFKDIRE
jgi:hypothetical protein